jgi:hypothetical protein
MPDEGMPPLTHQPAPLQIMQIPQGIPPHILLQPLPLPYIHENMNNIHIEEDITMQNEIV